MGHSQTGTPTRPPSHNADSSTVIPVRLRLNLDRRPVPLNAYTIPKLPARSMPLDRAKVFAHIDKNLPQHIAKVQELIRQPSISPENKGVRECANLVLSYLTSLGCKGGLEETAGNPVVYARHDAGA